MITQSGVLVFPDNDGAPTMRDIAISLARLPRFAGHTQPRIFTVGQHTIAGCRFGKVYDGLMVHFLLHDAHEAITNDIPRSWKSADMKEAQHDLDKRIYTFLGVPWPDERFIIMIKAVDDLVLHAEEVLVGPPGSAELTFGNLPVNEHAIQAVQSVLSYSEAEVVDTLLGIAKECGIATDA